MFKFCIFFCWLYASCFIAIPVNMQTFTDSTVLNNNSDAALEVSNTSSITLDPLNSALNFSYATEITSSSETTTQSLFPTSSPVILTTSFQSIPSTTIEGTVLPTLDPTTITTLQPPISTTFAEYSSTTINRKLSTIPINGTCKNYANYNENWLLIQRHKDNIVSFKNRRWYDYRYGFGSADHGNYWLGLEYVYQLQTEMSCELLIIYRNQRNKLHYEHYDNLKLGRNEERFRLKAVGAYEGSSGKNMMVRYIGGMWDMRRGRNMGPWWLSRSTTEYCNMNGDVSKNKFFWKTSQLIHYMFWGSERKGTWRLRDSEMAIRCSNTNTNNSPSYQFICGEPSTTVTDSPTTTETEIQTTTTQTNSLVTGTDFIGTTAEINNQTSGTTLRHIIDSSSSRITDPIMSSSTVSIPNNTTSPTPSSTTSSMPSATTSYMPSSATSYMSSSTTSSVPNSTETSSTTSSTSSPMPSATTSYMPSSTTSPMSSSTTSPMSRSATSSMPSSTTSSMSSSTTSPMSSSATSPMPSSTNSPSPSATTSPISSSTTSYMPSSTETSPTTSSTSNPKSNK